MTNSNRISIDETNTPKASAPRVVIVGGGFGGLAAAKALGKAPVEVILIDRENHHLFQPLLYQVATSVLAPSQISSPIREILRKQKNTSVILGEVTGADKAHHCVFVNSADRERVSLPYDYLIFATGQLSLRISVFLQWAWLFLTGQRGSRLIVNHHGPEPTQTKSSAAALACQVTMHGL
jgi:NADH dehydrogenase FAD-containing subunit